MAIRVRRGVHACTCIRRWVSRWMGWRSASVARARGEGTRGGSGRWMDMRGKSGARRASALAVCGGRRTVRVKHRYELEHKPLAEGRRAWVVASKQEREQAVQNVRRWRLARVDSGRDEDDLLAVEGAWPLGALGQQRQWQPRLGRAFHLVGSRYGNQVDAPTLERPCEQLSMIVHAFWAQPRQQRRRLPSCCHS